MKGQKWLLRILVGMLVGALILAITSVVTVHPAKAFSGSPPQPLGCRITQCTDWTKGPCGSCMGYRGEEWIRWCRVCDVCYGLCWPYQLDSLCVPCY